MTDNPYYRLLALLRRQSGAQTPLFALAGVELQDDGRVLLRKVEPGQIVQPGSALLSLALAGPTELVAQVDERFLDQLQPGQAASEVADAFPAQPFAAQLRSLAPAVDAQRGSVEVKLTPQQEPPAGALASGMATPAQRASSARCG